MRIDVPKDISILYRKMGVVLNMRFESVGLSTSKAMFLMCMYQAGPLTQADLCRKLDMDKAAVAKMLAHLEKDGFVTKCRNPEDIRSLLVSLTPKAVDLIPEIEMINNKWVDMLTENMTDIEREVFIQLLHKAKERASVIST